MIVWMVIIGLVLITTYLSTVNLSLIGMSRAELQQKLEKKGRPAAADWLYDELHAAILGTALLRTIGRIATSLFILAAWIDLGRETPVNWIDLLWSGLIAAATIWFTTIVLATAVARHAGVSMIVSNLTILRVLTWTTNPLSKAGMIIDTLVRSITGSRTRAMAGAELLLSIEDVHREGALDLQSAEMLENVVEFTNTEVSDVMIPHSEIEGIELTNDLGAIREFILTAGHSRIPVYKENLDHIVGILYVKDLVKYLGENVEDFKLEPLLRHPTVVPETKPVKEVLTEFQHSEVHMAIVVDEFGGTSGLVTIEDVLEEIVGDIRDEHEPADDYGPDLQTINETRVEVDGRFRIEELNNQLKLNLPEDGEFDTMAGFMLAHFGHVPRVGEAFDSHDARFTTLAATPTQVERVGIEMLHSESDNGEQG